MPLLLDPNSAAQMIRDSLAEFARTHPDLCAERAVVWFEPQYDHCGLYISTDAHTPKLLPADFDFQNFNVADVAVREGWKEQKKTLWAEVEALVRSVSQELPNAINPKLWAVQVDFDYYAEWRRGDENPSSFSPE